jgi:hypothetical protein
MALATLFVVVLGGVCLEEPAGYINRRQYVSQPNRQIYPRPMSKPASASSTKNFCSNVSSFSSPRMKEGWSLRLIFIQMNMPAPGGTKLKYRRRPNTRFSSIGPRIFSEAVNTSQPAHDPVA